MGKINGSKLIDPKGADSGKYFIYTDAGELYDGPSFDNKCIGHRDRGVQVTVYRLKDGSVEHNGFSNVRRGTSMWIASGVLKGIGNLNKDEGEHNPYETISGFSRIGLDEFDFSQESSVDNTDIGEKSISGNSDSSYDTLFSRYMFALGCPPQYNQYVDPQYYDAIGTGCGRRFSETMFSQPSIISLCPGKVSYLPGFNKKEKDTFFQRIKDAANDVPWELSDSKDLLSGKLFEFRSAYADYINVVNGLCREASILLGIGDRTVPWGSSGSGIVYKNYDYGFFTNLLGPQNTSTKGIAHIFQTTKLALSSAVGDSTYVHFFVNHQGTSLNENLSTSTAMSGLEEAFSTGSMHSMARNLEFLFGGTIGGSEMGKDIDRLIDSMPDQTSFIRSFARLAKNYLAGGRLVFPQMIDNVQYDKSMTVNLKFVANCGDKEAIFLRCYVPFMFLLALSAPKQLADNMYTYPYIVRAYQKGIFNTDLACIGNLHINRGGSDDTSWTVDGLSTEMDVSFDIVPLYSSLMVTSTKNPFMMINNTSMMEYLGTLCGIDFHANNLSAKIDLAMTALKGKVSNAPTNLVRGIVDTKLANSAQSFYQIMNR